MEASHTESCKQNSPSYWHIEESQTLSPQKNSENDILQPHTPPSELWDNSLGSKNQAHKKLQKWALRQIVNAKYNSHTEPILKRLKFLSVNDLYHLAALKLHHKHKNDELPAYFTDIFATQAPTHEYNTRNRQNRQQQSNTISASHSPRFVVPKLVETLPNPITSMVKQVKLQCFTRAIKKYLIGKYYETCPIYNCYICNQS